MNAIVSQISRCQGHELLNKLEAAGFDRKLSQQVIDSKGNILATRLAQLVRNSNLELVSLEAEDARAVMGSNFFGIEEATQYFGIDPSKEQLLALRKIPFSVEILKACKDTHVLVAVFPLSIVDIHNKRNVDSLGHHFDWYKNTEVAEDKGSIGWHLIRKTLIDNSKGRTFWEQRRLLSAEEELPKIRVMYYLITGQYLLTGERLFGGDSVRCFEEDFPFPNNPNCGRRPEITFEDSGIHVSFDINDRCAGNVGITSVRKYSAS